MTIEQQVEDAIKSSTSMREAACKVDIHYLTFRRIAKRLGKWVPNQGKSGGKKTKIPLQEILEGKFYGFSSSTLKARLLKAGIKENKCEKCGIDHWMNQRLVCELDHINGDSGDHKLENLRMLCPNCHSQTPTFRARNKRPGSHSGP